MAGLSSITRTRCVSKSGSLCIKQLPRLDRKRQGKRGTLTGTGAFRVQRAAHLFGCERAAVQSEAVAVRASGEAVTEDSLQVFFGDADAGVDDGDEHRSIRCADPDGHLFFGLCFVA